jgi:type I restriction enzyme, S subunit
MTEKTLTTEMKEKELPDGWKWVRLGEVCEVKNGFAFKSANYKDIGIPIVRISDIQREEVKVQAAVKIAESNDFDDFLVKQGDILIAMSGATTGKFGIYSESNPAYQNQRVGRFQIIDRKLLLDKFLFYCLPQIKRNIEKDAYGGAQPNISSLKIERLPIPLPPLATQQAIVTKLEALLAELDAGIAHLKKAQEQLKLYRQSVLKWAFEGRLTNDHVEDGVLPDGWKWVRLGEVCSVRNGVSTKPTPVGDYKILRISAVRPNHLYLLDHRFLAVEPEASCKLQVHDLLFTRYNGSIEFVGVCARVQEMAESIYYPDKLIRCRLNEPNATLSKYIQYVSNYGKSRNFVLSRLKTTAGQTGISGGELKEMPILMPNISSIELIVKYIEDKFSGIGLLESELDVKLNEIGILRQSVFKAAFEGKL